MNCQCHFLGKKKIIKLLSSESAQRVLKINPFSSGNPKKNNWQTLQTHIRRHRIRRMIRVHFAFNKEISIKQ